MIPSIFGMPLFEYRKYIENGKTIED